jgi:hypothetical protein
MRFLQLGVHTSYHPTDHMHVHNGISGKRLKVFENVVFIVFGRSETHYLYHNNDRRVHMRKRAIAALLLSFILAASVVNVSAQAIPYAGTTTITPNTLTITWEDESRAPVTIHTFRFFGFNVAQLRTMVNALSGSVSDLDDGSFQLMPTGAFASHQNIAFHQPRQIDFLRNHTPIRNHLGVLVYPNQPGWVFIPEFEYNWASVRDVINNMNLALIDVIDDPAGGRTEVVVRSATVPGDDDDDSDDYETVQRPPSGPAVLPPPTRTRNWGWQVHTTPPGPTTTTEATTITTGTTTTEATTTGTTTTEATTTGTTTTEATTTGTTTTEATTTVEYSITLIHHENDHVHFESTIIAGETIGSYEELMDLIRDALNAPDAPNPGYFDGVSLIGWVLYSIELHIGGDEDTVYRDSVLDTLADVTATGNVEIRLIWVSVVQVLLNGISELSGELDNLWNSIDDLPGFEVLVDPDDPDDPDKSFGDLLSALDMLYNDIRYFGDLYDYEGLELLEEKLRLMDILKGFLGQFAAS